MKKVMVINDDPDFQFLMKSYLEREGFIAYTIDDDEPVFHYVENYKPDIVVIDIQKERDKKICRSLKEKEKGIRVVVLTDPSEQRIKIDCEPDAIIRKPFEPNQFLRQIKSLI